MQSLKDSLALALALASGPALALPAGTTTDKKAKHHGERHDVVRGEPRQLGGRGVAARAVHAVCARAERAAAEGPCERQAAGLRLRDVPHGAGRALRAAGGERAGALQQEHPGEPGQQRQRPGQRPGQRETVRRKSRCEKRREKPAETAGRRGRGPLLAGTEQHREAHTQHTHTPSMSQNIDSALLQSLDEGARKEVLAFIQQESSKAKIQTSVTQFTDMCFKKCVTQDITAGTLDVSEERCVGDCLNRFLDTNIKVVQLLQALQR